MRAASSKFENEITIMRIQYSLHPNPNKTTVIYMHNTMYMHGKNRSDGAYFEYLSLWCFISSWV